jgi:hypothetical protein
MSGRDATDWTAANQRLLVAELVRLKALLGEGDPKAAEAALEAAQAALPAPAAVDVVGEVFGLSDFEREVLLLAAGVEMDSRLAALCGETAGQPQRSSATFGLALAALPGAHWSALSPSAPLRRWRLVEIDEGAGLTAARLRIDESVLHFLAGVSSLDARLQPLLRLVDRTEVMAADQLRAAEQLAARLMDHSEPWPVVQLGGDDPLGQEDVAAEVARALGLELYAVAAADLPSSPAELHAFATLWQREAALSARALFIERADEVSRETVQRLVERLACPVFVAGREPFRLAGTVVHVTVDRPGVVDQRRLWQELLGSPGLNGALDALASQYRLSARTIAATVAQVIARHDDGESLERALWRACRGVESVRLDALAQRIEPVATWDDLVLPEAQMETLRRIAAHVRHRLRVYHDWGFAAKSSRGLGIGALFAGESGTGKTMAAEVLARALELELYRIDLSAVISKYIGETEKNLRRVFDAAEESGAILLFDEADALFGKRSEVKDSHDRYANIEVSYLLQRMEAYRGLAILTTNQKAALDTAFQRRLRFVVQFPFPDAAQREAIWRGIFPGATPLDRVDCAKLAQLSVSGGHIRNIALNAAFLAAEADTSVTMAHLLRAAHLEAAKREKPLSDAETRGWV